MLVSVGSGIPSFLMVGWLEVLAALHKSTSHDYRCPGAREGIISGGNRYRHAERKVDLFLVCKYTP